MKNWYYSFFKEEVFHIFVLEFKEGHGQFLRHIFEDRKPELSIKIYRCRLSVQAKWIFACRIDIAYDLGKN